MKLCLIVTEQSMCGQQLEELILPILRIIDQMKLAKFWSFRVINVLLLTHQIRLITPYVLLYMTQNAKL